MKESGVARKLVRPMQDMYKSSMTDVRCAVGVTDGFKLEEGLHQGSTLSPLKTLMKTWRGGGMCWKEEE